MTQYRHLYWDSSGQDLRMFADAGGTSGTTLEVLSYYIRKRYAYLLDTGGTTIPGSVGTTQPDSSWYGIGGASNTHRIMGQHTEPNDNIPWDDPTRDALAHRSSVSGCWSSRNSLEVTSEPVGNRPINQVAEEIKKKGGKTLAISADLSDDTMATGIVDQATSEFGCLDFV